MERKPAVVLRAAEIREQRRAYTQRLNPGSFFRGTSLASRAGFQRTGVSVAWLPPGKDAFALHAHQFCEEWMLVLAGRGRATVGAETFDVGPGDFLGFPVPSVAHLLSNPFDEELVYVMGGERRGFDVLDYPGLDKRYLLLPGDGQTDFHELAPAIQPFGPADD
jgi:uncharacterized cupin superfamily protein